MVVIVPSEKRVRKVFVKHGSPSPSSGTGDVEEDEIVENIAIQSVSALRCAVIEIFGSQHLILAGGESVLSKSSLKRILQDLPVCTGQQLFVDFHTFQLILRRIHDALLPVDEDDKESSFAWSAGHLKHTIDRNESKQDNAAVEELYKQCLDLSQKGYVTQRDFDNLFLAVSSSSSNSMEVSDSMHRYEHNMVLSRDVFKGLDRHQLQHMVSLATDLLLLA